MCVCEFVGGGGGGFTFKKNVLIKWVAENGSQDHQTRPKLFLDWCREKIKFKFAFGKSLFSVALFHHFATISEFLKKLKHLLFFFLFFPLKKPTLLHKIGKYQVRGGRVSLQVSLTGCNTAAAGVFITWCYYRVEWLWAGLDKKKNTNPESVPWNCLKVGDRTQAFTNWPGTTSLRLSHTAHSTCVLSVPCMQLMCPCTGVSFC